ncbi:hypothetical protein C8R42DRAFT_174868 [Lentinula raphanica]|nr:hypothetical protein C8R42DRAFT_174868 [Lentinula raphanica]
MPRARSLKNGQPSEAYNPATCSICNAVISNKTDLPRHMKIHSLDRDKLMHRCPYPDCSFENLQKSNVETHIRTHTKSKTNCCPDCDFTTVDPGSLTRHRKRIHGYIPKIRRSRHPKPQPDAGDTSEAGSKQLTLRFSPYSHSPNQPSELPPHWDSQLSVPSNSPSSFTDLVNPTLPPPLSECRSGSRSPLDSQPPPQSRSRSPLAMSGHPYPVAPARQSSRSPGPQRRIPSPPLDPALLMSGPSRAIVQPTGSS